MAIRYQTRVSRAATPLSHFLSSSSSPAIPDVYADEKTDGEGSSTVVTTAVSILRSHPSRSRWNFLKSHLPSSGISPADASAIIVHLRNNPRIALRFFLWSGDVALCLHDITSFSAIIHVLARSRRRSAALSLLRAVIRANPDIAASSLVKTLARTYRSCDSAPFVFDLLIQAYLHSHHLDEALSVVSVLRSRGIHPLPSTANALLRAAGRHRGSAAALDLYRNIVERIRPNSQTFNDLLLALYRDGRTESNGEILADMARFGCDPNAFTYSILISGLCDFGNVAGARKLWEEMVAKGIKPDLTTYNTLIKGYCEAGENVKGEELYREMVLEGVEATGTTFELLIKGRCRSGGNIEAAMLVYEEMRRRGFPAEAEVVDEMLEGMCEKGMVEEGMKVLRDEMGREGISMCRRRSYVVLIKGLCDSGRMEEAGKLQAEMAGKGFEADEGVYGAFICGFERAGDFEMAERLRKEMARLALGDEGC